MDFGKQYGPLPLGAWVAVIAGGLGIALWSRQKGGSSGPVVVEDTSGQAGVGAGAGGLWVQSSAPPTEVAKVPQTNEEWSRVAINYLIAQGYDPAVSDTAIRKYLESTPLTLAENALVKIALAHLGSPPIPLPVPPDLPTPPPTQQPPPAQNQPPPPPPPPANVRWVTVTPWPTKHSTLWGIASTVYGQGSKWPTLYNANRVGVRRPDGSMGMIKNPDLIYAGWRIYCP